MISYVCSEYHRTVSDESWANRLPSDRRTSCGRCDACVKEIEAATALALAESTLGPVGRRVLSNHRIKGNAKELLVGLLAMVMGLGMLFLMVATLAFTLKVTEAIWTAIR